MAHLQEQFDEQAEERSKLLQSSPDDAFQKTYSETLASSKRFVRHLCVSGVMAVFFHMSRMTIYLLYAESLGATTDQLVLIMYGSKFWCGIAALVCNSVYTL